MLSAASHNVLADYETLTARSGVVDWSGRTLIEVKGKDRAKLLHGFCTNDINNLAVGSGCEAVVTNVQGKSIGHVHIFAEAQRHLLSSVPGQAALLIKHFDHYVISEDVTFRDLSAEWGQLLVAGPGVREGVPAGVWREWKGFSVPAVWSIIDRSQLPLTLETLAADGIPTCSDAAWQMLRVESGYPEFGVDFTDSFPQELCRNELAISFKKGCYLGQEPIARIDALGHVNQQLTGLRFAADAAPPLGEPLLAGEKVVGKVTSLAWSPKLSAPLGLALVRRNAATPGTQLSWSGGRAEVVALPVA